MSLNPNQFTLSTLAGTKVSGDNVMTVEFYSATSTDTIAPGTAVIIASTATGLVTKVSAGAGLTAAWFGVVLTNTLTDTYAVGNKMEIAFFGTIVKMAASAAITAGSQVQFDPSTGLIATKTATNTVFGIALENAVNSGDLIPVVVVASLV